MKHLFRTKLYELRNQFSQCAIQKEESKVPHYFTLSDKSGQIALTFPIATIKMMAARLKDIYPCTASN